MKEKLMKGLKIIGGGSLAGLIVALIVMFSTSSFSMGCVSLPDVSKTGYTNSCKIMVQALTMENQAASVSKNVISGAVSLKIADACINEMRESACDKRYDDFVKLYTKEIIPQEKDKDGKIVNITLTKDFLEMVMNKAELVKANCGKDRKGN